MIVVGLYYISGKRMRMFCSIFNVTCLFPQLICWTVIHVYCGSHWMTSVLVWGSVTSPHISTNVWVTLSTHSLPDIDGVKDSTEDASTSEKSKQGFMQAVAFLIRSDESVQEELLFLLLGRQRKKKSIQETPLWAEDDKTLSCNHPTSVAFIFWCNNLTWSILMQEVFTLVSNSRGSFYYGTEDMEMTSKLQCSAGAKSPLSLTLISVCWSEPGPMLYTENIIDAIVKENSKCLHPISYYCTTE